MKISLLRAQQGDWSTDMLMDIFVREDYGIIPDNITIVDIGANIGAFALYAAYNHNNKCYSFEPELANFQQLKENVEINFLNDRIKIFNIAVSGNCEDKKLYKHESIAHSLNRESDEFDIVKATDLNTIINENDIGVIDFLKIDCEGSEFEILYNTDDGTYKKIKYMIIEYHNYSNEPGYDGDSLLAYLEKKGFSVIERKSIQEGLLGIATMENKSFYSKS